MNTFVTSLRTADARRANASRQMAACGAAFEFFDAVDGAAGHSGFFEDIDRRRFTLNTLRRDPAPGEIGCYASHLSLWKWAIAHQRCIVVLEDDFHLEPGFSRTVKDLEPLVEEFGFIRLQSMHGPRALLKRLRPAATEVRRQNGLSVHYLSDPPLYTLGYAVSPAAAHALAKASRTLLAPVDKFLQQTWIHRTPLFALSPPIVSMSDQTARSTIGDRTRKSRHPTLLLRRACYKAAGEFRRLGFDRRQAGRLAELARNHVPP